MSTGHANGPSGYLCIICTCVSVLWIRWYVGYHLTTRSISFSTLLDVAHTNTQYIHAVADLKIHYSLAIFSDYTYIASHNPATVHRQAWAPPPHPRPWPWLPGAESAPAYVNQNNQLALPFITFHKLGPRWRHFANGISKVLSPVKISCRWFSTVVLN
jgi:hypothetical protein